METLIVATESQLTTIIKNVVGEFFKVEQKKEEPDNISGVKGAVIFLRDKGYDISESLFTKGTAKGQIPCRRFHNKRLLFSGKELLSWAESMCQPIGKSDAALMLAYSANRKLRGGSK